MLGHLDNHSVPVTPTLNSEIKASADEFPGPGTYNPKFSKSYSGWTQSKDDRVSTFIRDGLGTAVGTYHPN